MSDAVAVFFSAWAMDGSEARLETIKQAVTAEVVYDDPRTPHTLTGIDALNDYVGMFSANAPGWSATVVKSDATAEMTRATVAFGGPGPDGKDMVQHGQYFIEKDGDLIKRMVGFAGTGAPD